FLLIYNSLNNVFGNENVKQLHKNYRPFFNMNSPYSMESRYNPIANAYTQLIFISKDIQYNNMTQIVNKISSNNGNSTLFNAINKVLLESFMVCKDANITHPLQISLMS